MSDRIRQGRNKSGTLNFSTPSLVSPNTPTLANPIRGFGLPTNNPPVQTATDGATNLQEAQFADEQSLLPEINEHRPLSHDISRISLRRPQTQLTVSQPGDPYEQEANRVANQVMGMAIPQPLEAPIIQPRQDSLQRKCAACLEEEEELQTKTLLQPSSNSDLQTGSNIESYLNSSKGGGSPLSDEVRGFMEPRFGNKFDNVRVHTDIRSSEINQDLYAQAFTHGSDIYFGAGKSPGNNELTAHELTHVVQQTGAKTLQRQPINNFLSNKTTQQVKLSPDPITSVPYSTIQAQPQTNKVQMKCSACEAEERLQPKAISQNITPHTDNKSIQKFGWDDVKNTAGGVANWVGDKASDVAAMGKDAFASLVARVAPGLADLIRQGPMGLLGEKIKDGIKSWVSSITANIDVAGVIEQLQGSFTGVFAAVQGVVKGDPASCSNFANSLKALQDLGNAFMENAAFKQIQAAFSQVKGIFQKVTDLVIAPVFDTLMNVAGGVFDAVKGLATTIWNWGAPVRNTLGAAWDWVKEQLGIGGDGEGGVLGWLKAKASEVWTEIKGPLAPVLGPLKTVGSVLLAFSPVGPTYLIIKYLPQLVKSVEWLWAHKDDPDIVKKAHEEMGGTILPQLLSTVEGFGQTMQSTVTSLVNQAIQLSEAVLELLGSISFVPLLSMAQSMVQTVSNVVKGFITWCQEAFQSAAKTVQEFASQIATKIKPYIGVLTSIGMAIANPGMIPVILAGWAWQALDKCYKIPIINFLLDIVIGILQAAPSLPMFGLLWPIIKTGVLGFLQGLKGKKDDDKVAIANKLAKIISGGSPAFIFGFVKGLLKAIWEGLTDPFVLMYEAIKGLSNLITWLNDVANQALSTTPTDRQPASAQEGGASPATAVNNNVEIGQRMQAMAGELQPPVEQVGQGFMPAIQEIFTAGDGMSFEELMQKLGEAWGAVEAALTNAGATLADKVCQFMLQDSAEGEMGETIGWLGGTIAFEIVLSILTAGTDKPVRGAMKVLKTFAKILDWTGEAMGLAFKGLAKVGGFILDGIKGLGKLLNKAGGAAKVILDALGEIGQKLITFADELLGRAAKGAASEVVEEAGEKAAKEVAEEAGEKAAKEAVEESGEKAAKEGAEESGEKASERGGRNATDEAAERPKAVAAAKVITSFNEKLGTPVPVLLTELSALKNRYRWINAFETQPITLGHSRIVMRDVIDDDYNTARATMAGRNEQMSERMLNESDEAYAARLKTLTDEYQPRTKLDGTLETDDEVLERINDAERRLAEIESRSADSQANLTNYAKRGETQEAGITNLWTTKTGKPETLTLPGGKKIELRNPREMSTADIEAAAQKLEGQSGRAKDQLQYLKQELEKRKASDSIEKAKKMFQQGSDDKDVVRRILEGENHVWCESREQAQRVSNLLEEIAGSTRKQGDFHGPEVHVGTTSGPREIHFNVALKHNKKDIKSHIYFPEE
jgi:Domain of unknown function (DUF4157)